MPAVSYPIDYTGTAASNLVIDEPQVLTVINSDPFRYIIPDFAPFYVNNFKITARTELGATYELTYGIDYQFSLKFIGATRGIGQVIYGAITIVNNDIQGTIYLTYQCLGGKYSADRNHVIQTIAEANYNPRMVAWDQVTSIQETFPPTPHSQPLDTFTGYRDLIDSLNQLTAKIAVTPNPLKDMLVQHVLDRNDPHKTLELISEQAVTEQYVEDAIQAHVNAPNPHKQYYHPKTVEW